LDRRLGADRHTIGKRSDCRCDAARACSGKGFPLRSPAYPAGSAGSGPSRPAISRKASSPRSKANRPIMRSILDVILLVLQLYVWLLIAAAILSWLIAFNVVNTRNTFVAMVGDFLYRITEPVLRPIRNLLPNLGGIDVSPVILILIIFFLQSVIARYIYPNVF
jgi:YggT family protein